MKTIILLSFMLSPLAFADEASTATPPKTEETVTLSEEATAPLFDRIRGALGRALKDGKVVASSQSAAPATAAPSAPKTN